MNDFLKWSVKTSGTAILWVFILSISVKGRTVFSYANEVLVQNPMVQMVDEELSEVWDKIYLTARRTFSEEGIPETKEVF
jgi:hypothetical protein